jgi:hypothetical protein
MVFSFLFSLTSFSKVIIPFFILCRSHWFIAPELSSFSFLNFLIGNQCSSRLCFI